MNEIDVELAELSDQDLWEWEQRLFDDEVAGDDNWFLRDAVLWEMSRRGLI